MPRSYRQSDARSNSGYVQLERSFRKVEATDAEARSAAEARENAAILHYTGTGELPDTDLHWDDLLQRPLVVILGEPGSGKTWEFVEQTRQARSQRRFAFFVRLDSLVSEQLGSSLDPDDRELLANWKGGRRKATFFVDSVDESKFVRAADFKRTIDRLRHEIGDRGPEKTQIVISSRISEWAPETDAHYVATSFPSLLSTARDDEERARIFIAQLNPLNRGQVIKFAQAKGVTNYEGFAAAIDGAHAWDLSRRPSDVSDLLNFWLANRRLGSLQDIIEFSVRNGLKETPERAAEDPLSDERVQEGAQTLAATSILSRQFNICVPDPGHVSDSPGIDAAQCLPPDWRGEERRALLYRPIFDGAVYGRIRFHHRRLTEYLCAQWWTALLSRGLTDIELDAVFFASTGLGQVLRPSLAPVAAWLANGDHIWNVKMRATLLQHAPEVFLSFGDPTSLPHEYKQSVLSAILENFRSNRKKWAPTEPDAINRLVGPGLAEFLSHRLLEESATDDMRELVLKLILGGRIHQCGDAVLTLIADPHTSDDTRAYAILSIRDCGTPEQRRRLTEIAGQLPVMTPFVAARVCEAAFPGAMTVGQLTEMLGRLEEHHDETVNLPYYLSSRFKKVVTPELSQSLLVSLVQLAQTPPIAPDEYGREPISQRFRWLRKVIPTVLLELLSNDNLTHSEIAAAYDAINLMGSSPRQYSSEVQFIDQLRKRIDHHADLRRYYFWRQVQKLRHLGRVVSPTSVCEMQTLFELRRKDWSWVMQDVETKTDPADARLAFQCGWQLLFQPGRGVLDAISFYAKIRSADLRRDFRSSLFPTWGWALKYRWRRSFLAALFSRHWWEDKWGHLQQKVVLFRSRTKLLTHYFALKKAKHPGWLYRLAEEAHESNKLGVTDWSRVKQDYGNWIALGAREGCKKYWRTFETSLPHDRLGSNLFPQALVVGLSGLNAEIEDLPECLNAFSDPEVALATRYAVNEMNGFSWWLPSLMAIKTMVVVEVLVRCVEREWSWPADSSDSQGVLHKLVWNGDGLRSFLAEPIKQRLQQGDPFSLSVLRSILRLVLSGEMEGAAMVTELAPVRIESYPLQSEGWFLWMSVWLQVDALPAITYLEAAILASTDRKRLMIALCNHLSGERSHDLPIRTRPSFLRVEALKGLIELAFTHISMAEDVRHIGGFTPDARDDAVRFRDSLVYQLSQSAEEAATNVLLGLQTNPLFAGTWLSINWLNVLYEKRIVERSEATPWTETDIRDFQQTHEREPRNDEDLFWIAVKRLLALSDEVMRGENSPRSEVHGNQNEAFLRRWMTRKLRDNALDRYTATEESEIDLERYPDIRIEKPGIPSVSIEVKWADRWTLPELLERLENQLVETYLRPHSLRFGIYVLGFVGTKQSWEQPDGPNLNFQEVVDVVTAKAQTLSRQRPGQIGLAVIGIDFTNPVLP